jgi:hypothetical protein
MKTTFFIAIFYLLVFTTMTSCVIPTTRENYLKNFERFVSDVEKNGEKFNTSDWRWANKRFSKYYGEWYDKFQEDMKIEEKAKVNDLKNRYLLAKRNSRFGQFLHDELGKNLDKMKEDVKEYMKEDLNKDIHEISKGAREIGDSAVKVLQQVVKEIKKKE